MGSYPKFVEKTTSEKIVLIEMALGKRQHLWHNYTAGIWSYTWRTKSSIKNIGEGNIGEGNIGAGDLKDFIKIGSVFARDSEFDKKTNLVDCVSNEKSWYYDSINYVLYIHCENHDEPQISKIVLGRTMGLSNRDVYFEDLYYEPRLTSLMSIDKSKDSMFFGIMRFDGGSMTFRNNDGFFDSIKDNLIHGQALVTKFGGDGLDYEDFQTINKSYIDDVSLTFDELSVSVIDDRKKLSRKLPPNKFGTTAYPNLDLDDTGKEIPLGYGEIYHAPVICVNKEEGGTVDRVFKLCDVTNHTNGIEDIDEVYKIVDNEPVAVVSFTKQLAAGTATITNADWDANKKYICDYKGVKSSTGTYLQNPLDIIKDMLAVFADTTYNDTNYNTLEWEAAAAHDLANNIGLFIGKEREVKNLIEDICSCLGSFIVQDDNRYTFRILDVTDEPTKTIYIEEMIEPFEVEWEGTEFLSSANVGYKKDWNKKKYRRYTDNSWRDEVFVNYKRYNDKKFDTLLTNVTDAQECAEYLMALFQDIPAIYTVKTKSQNVNVEIMDMMNVEINRVEKKWLDYNKVSIIGVTKDFINNEVEITAQHISGFTGLYFRVSPYAINVDYYAVNISEYTLSYGRLEQFA